jgi:hypothetical protein
MNAGRLFNRKAHHCVVLAAKSVKMVRVIQRFGNRGTRDQSLQQSGPGTGCRSNFIRRSI